MSSKQNKYNSVSEMLRDCDETDAVGIEEFEETVKSRKLVKELSAIRVKKGISQEEMALRLECSQSRISKLENGFDDDLTIGFVRSYMLALGFELMIGAKPESWTLVDEIKAFHNCITRKFEQLSELVGDDHSIAAEIANFYFESVYNFNATFIKNLEKLPSNPISGEPYFSLCMHIKEGQPTPMIEEPVST